MLRIVGRERVDRGKINPFLGAHVCAIHIYIYNIYECIMYIYYIHNIQHRIYAYPAHRDIVYCMHKRRPTTIRVWYYNNICAKPEAPYRKNWDLIIWFSYTHTHIYVRESGLWVVVVLWGGGGAGGGRNASGGFSRRPDPRAADRFGFQHPRLSAVSYMCIQFMATSAPHSHLSSH